MTRSLIANRRVRAGFAITAVLWALMQTGIIFWFGYDLRVSATDGCISAALLVGSCLLIANTFQYYQPQEGRYLYILSLGVLYAAIWTFLTRFILLYIYPNLEGFSTFITLSLPLRFCFSFLAFGWMAMLSMLWYSQQEQTENEQRKTDAEKLAREAELFNLRQQLQPHFLFNSLNSITALIGSRPEEARKMIHQLSDFLRGTINKEQQPVSLQDELDHLQLYLDIEKVRFGHRLETEVVASEECKSLRLPPMLLQPIVENAIKFGLYDTVGKVCIRIQAECINNELWIHVRNPFDPETSRPRSGTGFGLKGVKRRLYLLFARTDLLQTSPENHIFTTTVKIPQA